MSFGIGLIILLKSKSALVFGISQFLGPLICFLLTKQIQAILRKFKLLTILKVSLLLSILLAILMGIIFGLFYNLLLVLILVIALLTLNSILSQLFTITYNISCPYLVNSEAELMQLKSLEEIIGSIALIISPLLAAFLFTIMNSTAYIVSSAAIDFITLVLMSQLIFQAKAFNSQEARKLRSS